MYITRENASRTKMARRFPSGGPLNGVAPGNSEWAGGSITPAGPPTTVGGSFGGVGAAGGPPPSFGTPATAFARNDRGSNIRIPYTRVVAMHSKDRLPVFPSNEQTSPTTIADQEMYEYDGLDSGELAWIMSKQFAVKPAALSNVASFPPISTAIDISGFASKLPRMDGPEASFVYSNSAAIDNLAKDGSIVLPSSGMGGTAYNRMERMAYTSWVESHIKLRAGRQVINLLAAQVSAQDKESSDASNTSLFNTELDSELQYYDNLKIITGGNMFAMPDIAYALQTGKDQVKVPMMQGLNVMEKGPFLRSYGVEHSPIEIGVTMTNVNSGNRKSALAIDVDRHVGSSLAQGALACELKKAGLMNWTPDGICLSKFATGPDEFADKTFDARSGQLFNIAIQGATVTKSWSNMSSEMAVLPMDKLFVLMVAELSYEVGAADANIKTVNTAAELTKAIATYGLGSTESKAASTNYVKACNDVSLAASTTQTDLQEKYQAFFKAVKQRESLGPNALAADIKAQDEAVAEAQSALTGLVDGTKRANVGSDDFKKTAAGLRNGTQSVTKASLMNFRLIRATSSYLSNRSWFDPKETPVKGAIGPNVYKSRCGLKIGFDKTKGSAEYIVGGWCIGSVVDSAASRAFSHNTIRTAPNTFAVSVNVNVEWWSADKLYAHYQDVERDAVGAEAQGTTFARTADPTRNPNTLMAEREDMSYDDAVQALQKGKGDQEGMYKRPNPAGLDTDPKGLNMQDRDGENAVADPRVWKEALKVPKSAGNVPTTEPVASNASQNAVNRASVSGNKRR